MSLSQSENNLRSRLYKRNDPDAEIKTVLLCILKHR